MLKKITILFISSLLLLLTYSVFHINTIFQEGNPIPISKAIIEVLFSKKEIVYMPSKDKYLSRADNNKSLITYAIEKGWTYVDQLGAGIFFESKDNKILVTSNMFSKYFVVYKISISPKPKKMTVKEITNNEIPTGQETVNIIRGIYKEKTGELPNPFEGVRLSEAVYEAANKPGISVEQARQIIMQATYETKLSS